MLPQLHSFVDIAVKNGPKGSVCIENTGSTTLVTSALPGMSRGQVAMFAYSTSHGKYRFTAEITAVDEKNATFAVPARIETVQKFGGQRARHTVRIDTTTPCQWRFAPVGKIETTWQKGVLSDISRSGASLSADREVKTGSSVELSVPLLLGGKEISLRGDVRRVDKIEGSKKYGVGLQFARLSADGERAIIDFINRRQTDLRNRGLG